MSKLKRAIIDKYLPSWCRAELMDENEKLRKALDGKKAECERLSAYIDGMHDALKYRQKIVINERGDST